MAKCRKRRIRGSGGAIAQLICRVYLKIGRLKVVQVHETTVADTLHQLTVSFHGPRYLGGRFVAHSI